MEKSMVRVKGMMVTMPMTIVMYMARETLWEGFGSFSLMWIAESVQRKPGHQVSMV